jgi:hypothetical protein
MSILEWAWHHFFWSYILMGFVITSISAVIWGEEWKKEYEEKKKKKPAEHVPLEAVYVVMFFMWPIQLCSIFVDSGRAIKKAIFNRKTYVCECKHVNKKSAKFCSCCGKTLT